MDDRNGFAYPDRSALSDGSSAPFPFPRFVCPVLSGSGRRPAYFAVLAAALPAAEPKPIGVILLDPASDTLYCRMRANWDDFPADDAEILAGLGDQITEEAERVGGAATLKWLEDTLSNTVRISERETVSIDDPEVELARLYAATVRGDG